MDAHYDLVVIGSGTAAQVVAARCREAGWQVAVIDYRPLGGTCALRGCDPKKVLISGVEAQDAFGRMLDHGLGGEARIEWSDLMDFKRTFTDPVPASQRRAYAEQGIDVFHDTTRFIGENRLQVGRDSLTARYLLIATGAKPTPLAFPGAEHLIDSTQFLELERLPRRIVLVGGGYIAAEFAHLAARAGASVSVLQRGPRLLKGFEPDLVGWLMEKFRDIGVDVRTDTEVEAVDESEAGYLVYARRRTESQVVEADLVVHAAGRVPELDPLNLQAANVELKSGRPVLNEYLQSTGNPAVYAAGDANGLGPALTPVASHEGRVLARNLLDGNRRRPDYRGVPSVAFTVPPTARVGMSESELQAEGMDYHRNCARTESWFTARRLREPVAGYKVLLEKGTGRILGAPSVGGSRRGGHQPVCPGDSPGFARPALEDAIFTYPTATSEIGYMLQTE